MKKKFIVMSDSEHFLYVWCMQVKAFKPKLVSIRDESLVDELKEALSGLDEKPEIIPGEQGLIEVSPTISICIYAVVIS